MIVNALSYLSILALMLGCNTGRKVTHTLTKDTVQDKKTSAQAEQQTNIPPIIGNKGSNSPDATGLKEKQKISLKKEQNTNTQKQRKELSQIYQALGNRHSKHKTNFTCNQTYLDMSQEIKNQRPKTVKDSGDKEAAQQKTAEKDRKCTIAAQEEYEDAENLNEDTQPTIEKIETGLKDLQFIINLYLLFLSPKSNVMKTLDAVVKELQQNRGVKIGRSLTNDEVLNLVKDLNILLCLTQTPEEIEIDKKIVESITGSKQKQKKYKKYNGIQRVKQAVKDLKQTYPLAQILGPILDLLSEHQELITNNEIEIIPELKELIKLRNKSINASTHASSR